LRCVQNHCLIERNKALKMTACQVNRNRRPEHSESCSCNKLSAIAKLSSHSYISTKIWLQNLISDVCTSDHTHQAINIEELFWVRVALNLPPNVWELVSLDRRRKIIGSRLTVQKYIGSNKVLLLFLSSIGSDHIEAESRAVLILLCIETVWYLLANRVPYHIRLHDESEVIQLVVRLRNSWHRNLQVPGQRIRSTGCFLTCGCWKQVAWAVH
jgi:hypothetical protein